MLKIIENIKSKYNDFTSTRKITKEKDKLQNSNPYFLDFPISDESHDYIGFDSYIDGLHLNIKDDAKMIGIVADYGSGKSTVVSLLEKRLKPKRFRKTKYKIVKINLWDSLNKEQHSLNKEQHSLNKEQHSLNKEQHSLNKEQHGTLNIHKKFLFQLSSKLKKKSSSYLNKKLNPNYGILSISTKNGISVFLLIFALFNFVIHFLNQNELLHYFNFLPSIGLERFTPLVKMIADFSGIVSLITIIILLLTNEIVFSFIKSDSERKITESDSVEVYLDLIKKYSKKKKLIIVIEDLDRITDDRVKVFLKEIYTFYSHSDIKNVTFVIAINPCHYLGDSKNNYKLFDYVVDLQKLQLKDFEYIMKELLNSKKEILLEKFDIDINDETIGKWMWLARGKSLDIRQLKHRYNDTLLQYSTLINRFPHKRIELNSCIAVNYIKNEYPALFQNLINEEINKDNDEYSDIRKIVSRYMKNNNIKSEEMFSNLTLEYEDEDFKNDLLSLLKNKYIRDDLSLYFYNYPKGNEIFDFEESILNHNYVYDEKEFDNIEEVISKINDTNKDFIKIPMERRRNLDLSIPEMIFKNDLLFNLVYNNCYSDEQEYIFKNMLKLNSKNKDKTLKRLEFIYKSQVIDNDIFNDYISAIREDFRTENEDTQLVDIRLDLLKLFDSDKNYLTDLYSDQFPIISKLELDIFTDFEEAFKFIYGNKINSTNIGYITEKISNIYKLFQDYDDLCSLYEELPDELFIDFFYKLNIISEFDDKNKIDFKNKFSNKLKLDTPEKIIKFIKKMEISFEDLEKQLILNNEEGIISDEDYCDFIDSINIVSLDTISYISKDKFKYPFNLDIQKSMFENKLYDSYVRSKMLYENVLNIEEDKIAILESSYKKIFEDIDNNEDYIVPSNSALDYFKSIELYKEYGEDNLAIFGHVKQNYDMLDTILNKIDDNDILDTYILNIPELEITNEECGELINKYVNKLVTVSDKAHKHFKSILPSKSLKLKINKYRECRRDKILQNQ